MDEYYANKQHPRLRNNVSQDQPIKPPIHMLNYDCFWKIFSYLEPKDLCLAARTSKYFGYVARNQMKCIKTLDISKMLSSFYFGGRISRQISDYRTILKNCGDSLTTVILVLHLEIPEIILTTLISLISQHCKHLRHLYFRNVNILTIFKYPKIKKDFISIVKLLQSLELPDCGLTEEFAMLLPFTKNLNKLNLSYNLHLTGAVVSKMVNLVSLNFEKCQRLTPINFGQILNNNKSLQYLNVRNCLSLSEDNYLDIIKLTELIHLVISGNPNTGIHNFKPQLVAQISNLKKLEIFECFYSDEVISIIFINLARVNQLEYLVLDGRNPSEAALNHLKCVTSLKSYKYRVNNVWVEESFQTKDASSCIQIK